MQKSLVSLWDSLLPILILNKQLSIIMFQRINMNKLAMKKYIITFAQKIILNMSEHFKQLLEIATSQGNRTNVEVI